MKETNQSRIEKLNQYLSQNLHLNQYKKKTIINDLEEDFCYFEKKLLTSETSSLEDYLNKKLDNNNFQKTLFTFIDKTNKKDSEIYNKAFIDHRLFSKIKNDGTYHPTKNTIISLGLALELNIKDFEILLESASYSLPKNNYFDLIIRFCIEEKIYNIIEVNNLLNEYNCPILNE